MFCSKKVGAVLSLIALINGVKSLDYSTLEATGVSCPDKDRCLGYTNDKPYYERSCECDSLCSTYKDCCIDARPRSSRSSIVRGSEFCVPIGIHPHEGIYAINRCSRTWTGSEEIRSGCEGPTSLRDPLLAAPVISVSEDVAYKNRYCAECNFANMESLTTLLLLTACDSLSDLSEAQIIADITYNDQHDSWGIYRMNSFGNATNFHTCDIYFDVPPYANRSVRYCRSNITSTCPQSWTRNEIRTLCGEYMSVVYGLHNVAYKNPHCALCNGESYKIMTCTASLSSRTRPMSFALLLDINPSDGDKVGLKRVPTPECATNYKYDPYFKKCRALVCAIPGFVVRDEICVPP